MSEADWWKEIEQYMQQYTPDWSGVLVCCDGLQEMGKEEMADTLRWLYRVRHTVWVFFDKDRAGGKWGSTRNREDAYYYPSLECLVQSMAESRKYWQEFYA